MNKLKSSIGVTLLVLSLSAMSDVAVVVHPSNSATVTEEDVQRIFLGKSKTFSSSGEAIAVNNKDSSVRDQFNQALLGKNESQLKAYWSQLVFTGKGTPPKELDNDDAVKAFVASTPNAIGYIDSGKVDASVRSVLSK